MPRTRTLLVASLLCLSWLGACSGTGSDPRTRPPGATSFEAQPPGGSSRSYAAAGAAGLPMPATNTGAGTDATTSRPIQEADVYQRDGTLLYVLNAYRGLQAVDLTDPAAPQLRWRVPITGRPIDLYLRGGVALVAVSDAFSYVAADDGSVHPRRGSRLLAIDVTGTGAPSIVTDLTIDGEVEQTRIVGDVLYVVSRRYAWYDWVPGSGGTTVVPGGSTGSGTASAGSTTAIAPVPAGAVAPGADTVFVASFGLADARHPAEVARVELTATGWRTHANVTDQRITLSFAGYGPDASGQYGPLTEFRVIDISDPGGAMALGGAMTMPGTVQDRWSMDYGGGIFRAVSNLGWNAGAALSIWSSPEPSTATRLSELVVPVAETLTAARFDGGRVYVVTAKRTDPLWAVDASDPVHPVIRGSLHMAGQLEFIEPRGDRLVALGHTDEAGGGWQLAVTLLDVSDLAAPAQLGPRATFGPSWGSVSASADDLRKAFLVFDPPPDGIGLVLVPFQGWDATTYRFVSAMQLIDYASGGLALRGSLAHPGAITRAFPLDAGGTRLIALSDAALQTVTASDRDHPSELARLDLARSVSTLTIVGADAIELCGDWYRGAMELAVTDARDPDAATPLARVDLAAPEARMLRDGDLLWILAHDSAGGSWLQGVDVADPPHPRLRGHLDLAPGETFAYGRWWGFGDDAVLVGHALAIHHGSWACFGPCPLTAVAPTSPGGSTAPGPGEIRVYDLSDPDHPRLASTVAPDGAAWAWGLSASGTYLWLTHFAWSAPPDLGRYYLDRIDLADPASPKLLTPVNVPGVFLAADPDGRRVYTVETASSDTSVTTSIHRLALESSTARLEASATVDGYPSGVASAGGFAWMVTSTWSSAAPPRLVAVDLGTMARTSDQPVSGGWAWLRTAAGGKLFVDAGWQEQGLLVYGLGDPARPVFEQFFRTPGWVSDVVVSDGRAYLPSGPYGVPVIDLK